MIIMQPIKISDNIYEIPKDTKVVSVNGKIKKFDMNVSARIYANTQLMDKIKLDRTLDQLSNIACLPGIKKYAIAMSDAHQGYGFCIGGVAATDLLEGAISPGGVGYDINCGVNLMRTNLQYNDISAIMPKLTEELFKQVPCGLGSRGHLQISRSDLDRVLDSGIEWALEKGYGWAEDAINCEEHGSMKDADSSLVSEKAKARGIRQLGSLGSGNHFIEVQKVEEIYDEQTAKVMGITNLGQVLVMIHTGSRAVGHQVCTDSLREMEIAIKRENIQIPDRELACVMGNMKEADQYLKRMNAAANFAWTNRQIIMEYVRTAFKNIFHQDSDALDMNLIYGLAHNILKREEHIVDGKRMKLNVHRKGATRCFPPGHNEVNSQYKNIGQPVLIPGSMGTASYLCVGLPNAMEISFGSTAHGSGRQMSRSKSKKIHWGGEVRKALNKQGISIRAASDKVIAEEAPGAYKDIDQVVQVSHDLGIVKKVVKLLPMGVTKG
ncbi:MAG: RtcB family protein [archaeon]|nr:RtcB family protein [archaeon]